MFSIYAIAAGTLFLSILLATVPAVITYTVNEKQVTKSVTSRYLEKWGDEILADMPSCLGGEDNRINYV